MENYFYIHNKNEEYWELVDDLLKVDKHCLDQGKMIQGLEKGLIGTKSKKTYDLFSDLLREAQSRLKELLNLRLELIKLLELKMEEEDGYLFGKIIYPKVCKSCSGTGKIVHDSLELIDDSPRINDDSCNDCNRTGLVK